MIRGTAPVLRLMVSADLVTEKKGNIMREKRCWKKKIWLRMIGVLACTLLVVLSGNTMSASAQTQENEPWGTQKVEELNQYKTDQGWKVPNGWYHYTASENSWENFGTKNYTDTYSAVVWRKIASGYQKVSEIGTSDELAYGEEREVVKWIENADYYIQTNVNGNSDLELSIYSVLEMQKPDVPGTSDVMQLNADGKASVSVTGSDESKWIKYIVPEDGLYKFRFQDEKAMARVDVYTLNNNQLSNKGGRTIDYNRKYLDFKKGEVLYIRCRSWQEATSYELSVKKTEKKLDTTNYEHAKAVRSTTKAGTIAAGKAAGVIEYLNAMYKNTNRGLYVGHMDDTDKEVLKKLAQMITKDCTSETEKADAIVRWVGRNIKYDTSASSYSPQVFYTRKGDCYGDTMLITDLCKLSGLRAAVVDGWKADLTKWTVEELYDLTGHAWNYIYADGKWRMYDCLWGNYNITDSAVVADKGYYSSAVEGIYIAGDNVDPAFASLRLIDTAATYLNGKFVLLKYGVLANSSKNNYYVDSDKEIIDIKDTGVYGWTTVMTEDRFYPSNAQSYEADINGNTLVKTDATAYTDGRPLPGNSMLFRDGWIVHNNFNNGISSYYADQDGILYNSTIETIDNTTYYFAQTGEAFKLNLPKEQYSLTNRYLTVPTGVKAQFMVNQYIQEIGINKNPDAELIFHNNQPDLIDIDSDGTITTKKEGFVDIEYDVKSSSGAYWVSGAKLEFLISNEKKPTPDYTDRPVGDSSSGGEEKDDNNKDDNNKDNNNKDDNNKDNDNKDNDNKDPETPSDDTKKVSMPKTYKLSSGQYVYDGKVKNPSVKITDKNGKVIAGSNYMVSKSSGRKNVGTYTYKIVYKGAYKEFASKTLSFTILPKGTTLTKAKKAGKAFTVYWKKRTGKMAFARISGYQIRYSLKSNMSQSKTGNVSGYKYTSKKIKNLKAKKKYYIQIRTYMKVKGKTYYSGWSGKKSVVTGK